MKTNPARLRSLALSVLCLAAAPAHAADLVATVGDSIVANYSKNSASEKHGWGERLGSCFSSSKARVSNFGAGGRSTKSFEKEGRWKDVLRASPKWIFIQFGHNDQSKYGKEDAVGTSVKEYGQYLKRYLDDAKKQGAKVVLVTPPPRRSGSSPDAKLKPYADEMKRVGAANQVTVVDLHSLWGSRYKQLGSTALKQYYVNGENTHFTLKGASELANLICADASSKLPALQALRK